MTRPEGTGYTVRSSSQIGESVVLEPTVGLGTLLDEQGRRLFAGPVRWYTDDSNLLYLNDRWGYEEGELDLETVRLRTRAYLLEPEAVP